MTCCKLRPMILGSSGHSSVIVLFSHGTATTRFNNLITPRFVTTKIGNPIFIIKGERSYFQLSYCCCLIIYLKRITTLIMLKLSFLIGTYKYKLQMILYTFITPISVNTYSNLTYTCRYKVQNINYRLSKNLTIIELNSFSNTKIFEYDVQYILRCYSTSYFPDVVENIP